MGGDEGQLIAGTAGGAASQVTLRLVSALGLSLGFGMAEAYRDALDPQRRPDVMALLKRLAVDEFELPSLSPPASPPGDPTLRPSENFSPSSRLWAALADASPGTVDAWAELLAKYWTFEHAAIAAPDSAVQPLRAMLEDFPGRGVTLELVLLLDCADPRHLGIARILGSWFEKVYGARSPVKFKNVGVSKKGTYPLSALDDNLLRDLGLESANGKVNQGQVELAKVGGFGVLEQKFLAVAIAELTVDPSTVVYVNGLGGMTVAKNLLAQAAEVAFANQNREAAKAASLGETSVFRPLKPSRVVATAGASGAAPQTFRLMTLPSTLSYSEIHHRFGRAVSLTMSNALEDVDVRRAVHDEGLEAFVRPDENDKPILSDIAWTLVEAAEFHDGPPFSACVDLLGRLDRPDLSARLYGLIQHWHRQRLWSKNLAPEMVLHDEAHSQAVDRHIASLAETLVRDQKLDPYDVYLLALAGWLHDWGHASAGDLDTNVAHPREVRDLHGLLTRARLKAPDLKRFHRLTDVEAEWVGLLSAHHQSWTSCGGLDPADEMTGGTPEPLPLPDTIRKWKERPVDRVASAGRAGLPIGSLDGEFTDAIRALRLDKQRNPWPGNKVMRRRARTLVALLRICDAADIGAHRVPHRASSTENSHDCWRAASALGVATLAHHSAALELYKTVFTADNVRAILDVGDPGSEKRREEVYAEMRSLLLDAAKEGGVESADRLVIERDFEYLLHLSAQRGFFESHASVASVHLTLRKAEENALDLVPFVRVSRQDDSADARSNAVTMVLDDIQREFGSRDPRSLDAARREPVRAAMKRLGIRLSNGEVVSPPEMEEK